MDQVILRSNNLEYEAEFFPNRGMNLGSFKRQGVEVIDQSTARAFEERFTGLGPLIGPHFHRRKSELIPKIKEGVSFPHIEYCKKMGIDDYFSHGIARHAPWKVESSSNAIQAELSGKDVWNGMTLAELEGQDFLMRMEVKLIDQGLQIELSIVSDTDSLVGLHYYYRLPPGKSVVKSTVQNKTYIDGILQTIPDGWGLEGHLLRFDLNKNADYTFFPKDPLKGEILLETSEYFLKTAYQCHCQENSWQLYCKEKESFVCIEPISSQDPRHPNLSVSSLAIQLQIEFSYDGKNI